MHVTGLWRYPIKSLGGEALDAAELTLDGVLGDRVVHVAGLRGPVTGRTRHGLLTLPVSTGDDGVPRLAGHPWDSTPAQELVRAAAPGAGLVAYAGPERFDVLNMLVATDGAVASFGHDVRRLRPNVLIGGGVPAEAEATWPGRALAIGDALIGVHSLRQRCIVTTIDPDTGVRDLAVLRQIREDFDGELALNCWVIRPGQIAVGDTAELVETDAAPLQIGGWTVGAPYRAA